MRRVIKSEVWESENIWTRAQIYTDTGASLQTSDVQGVAVKVYQRADGATIYPATPVYHTSGIATSSSVYNTFQTSGWDGLDSTGYNFAHVVTSTAFVRTGGCVFRLEYTLSTSAYGPIYVIHDCRVRSTLDN